MAIQKCFSPWPAVSMIKSYGSSFFINYLAFIGHIWWVADSTKKFAQTGDYVPSKGHHMANQKCYRSWPKVSLIKSYGSSLFVNYLAFTGHIWWVADSTKKCAQTGDYVPSKGHHMVIKNAIAHGPK